jgi:hypothetical protein
MSVCCEDFPLQQQQQQEAMKQSSFITREENPVVGW